MILKVSLPCILMLICLPFFTIEARGGRGGGRAGGGRGSVGRGGGSIHRSPSLSRAAARPASSYRGQPIRTAGLQRPVTTTQLQRQPAAAAISRSGGNLAAAQQFRSNRPQQQMLNRQNANDLRNRYGYRNPGYGNWFNQGFFDSHNLHPRYYNRGVDWWRGAQWANVNSWVGAGWTVPVYYDSLNNAYYEDSMAYSQPAQTVVYDTGSYQPPSMEQAQSAWLPLGVFALSQTPELAAQSNMIIQLALNKSGEVSGTYFNTSTNKTYEVIGKLDKTTQQVTLNVANYPNPTITTALSNLTDYQASVRLYFTNGLQQVWTLTKLQK